MSVALIFSVLIKMFMEAVIPAGTLDSLNYISLVMVIVCFFILRKYKTNPLYLMLACGAITLVLNLTGLL
jgi:hypothetical protein